MTYANATCRGSIMLGTGCGWCEKCAEEKARIKKANEAEKCPHCFCVGNSNPNCIHCRVEPQPSKVADLKTIFAAGRVRRWHTNVDLSWTDDYNDGHQGRVARILLAYHPKPHMMLISAALTHDDGELKFCDMNMEAKRDNPELRAMGQVIEDAAICKMWAIDHPPCNDINADDYAWLKWADSLDSYMWMMQHRPSLKERKDWRNQRESLIEFARLRGLDLIIG